MKVNNLVIKEIEFKGNKIKQLYLILDNNEEYLIGTLKSREIAQDGKVVKINYVNCVHKEFKKN